MMQNNVICTLDLGSSKISACVAEIRRKQVVSIFAESISLRALSKGSIVNAPELVNSIGRVLMDLKNKSGLNIKYIYTNISGQDIVAKHSRAIMPLAERGNKVVTLSDIQKINEQALTLGSTLEEEIIYNIPYSYNIDAKNNILNPLGLYSHKLEVDMYLTCVKLSSLQSLTHAVNQAGYEVKGLFFSGIATTEAVFNKQLYEGINVFLDIGSDSTEILTFKEGLLRSVSILPKGGDDLTAKIQQELNIPFDFAEDIKRSYGIIQEGAALGESKEILIKKEGVYKPIKQSLISELITAEAKALCRNIKQAIEKQQRCCDLQRIVVCGRAILQDGFLEMLEATLDVNTEVGRIINPCLLHLANNNEILSGQKYLSYVTSLGMVCLVLSESQPQVLPANPALHNPVNKVISKLKDLYQEYF